jgi:hypothetical protein
MFRKVVVSMVAGAIAGGVLIAFALPALGTEGASEAGARGSFHGFRAPSRISKATGFTSVSGLKARYFATQVTVQPGAVDGASYKCPKKTPHAISGFFGAASDAAVGQVVPTDSFPSGDTNRTWNVGVKNLGTVPQDYFVGVVCVK